jgi:hypothetical protein
MSLADLEKVKELFFAFEDTLMEKSVLVGLAPESMVGVSLDPIYYDDDGDQKLKCLISIELTEDEEIDDDAMESIADTVSDYLRDNCDLAERLAELGIDPDILDWWPVEITLV